MTTRSSIFCLPSRLAAYTTACAAGLMLATMGAAQEEPTVVEEEMTVTAQRVEQELQDVPISIIAVSAEDLEQRAINDVQELADAAPGVVVSGQSSSTGELALTIRGIGSNTFGLGTESTVGYYVDGVYISRPQGFLNQFLDLERVEVLRGPQGTLWGRNSTGGAINVVTKAPSNQFEGRLFAELGEIDSPESAEEQRFAFSLGGGFSDRAFGRLSVQSNQTEDYTFNELLGRTFDNVDGYSVRGAVTFLPTESVSVTVRADLTDNDSHNNFTLRPGDIGPDSVLGTLLRFYDLDAPADVHRVAANIAPESAYEESGFSLDVNWTSGSGLELQSLTSFREFESRRVADVDASALDFVENVGEFDVEWYSQELKLTGSTDNFDWIGGLYYFHEEGATNVDTVTDLALFQVQFFAASPGLFLFNPSDFCSLGFLAPPTVCGPDYYNFLAPLFGLAQPGNKATGNFFTTLLDTDSYAAYGQVYWHVNDRFTLTAGLRFTEDDKEHSQTTIDFATLLPTTLVDSDSWDGVTPKLGLEYRPNDDVLLYGSVTTGFKSGGFNSISVQPSFDEETITSYEVGVKSTLADRRVTLNASAFHYEYDDLQVAVLFPDRSSVENAAQATVNGAELDVRFRPNRRFSLELGLSLLDDEFDDFFSQNPRDVAIAQDNLNAMGNFDPVAAALAAAAVPLTDLSGRSLQRAPDFSGNLALQYVFPVGSGSLTARGEITMTDDYSFDAFGEFTQDSYELLHANLSWAPGNGRWLFNLYGRNLGDEEYKTAELFARVTGSLQLWAPPASYGLQVAWSF